MQLTFINKNELVRVSNEMNFSDINHHVISIFEIREILNTVNISFILSGINRAQSTLLCELDDSYCQQSQRYVNMSTKTDLPIYIPEQTPATLANEITKLSYEAIELYERMTELKETASNSKRKTHDDFKYGIPYEDARYVLPLATTTNITVTMTADKLIDLYLLMYRYNSIFNDILKAFEREIPEDLNKLIIYIITAKYGVHKTTDFAFSDAHFAYEDYFNQLNSTNNVVPISFSGLSDVSIATLTSQNEKSPMDVFERWEYLGENLYEKSISMINRVISYGHTAILEHHRTTFAMECSLSAYHQVIRHRLQNIHRESIYSLTTPDKFDFYVPDSINVSQFKDEYIALMEKYKKILESIDCFDKHWLMIALPNSRMVKFIVSSNARNDITIFRDRLCLTAQTEIREMYHKKFSMLFDMYPQLYKYAVPPCVTSGKCKEGKLSCGNAEHMQDKYANVKNYKQK